MARAADDEVDAEQRGPQQQADRAGDTRQHRPPARRRGRPPARGDHGRRARGDREVEPALHAVDHVGDGGVGKREQERGGVVGEDQPERGEQRDLDDHGAEQYPVRGGAQPATRAVGQHQRDEEQRPEVGEPARGRDRQQRVVLAEQGGEEEGEPGGRHEQAAAAVRATPPRDQPARGEGTADQAQDDVDRIRRAVAEHHRRQHGQLGHRGDGPQREPDTAHVDHRGEPVDQPGAACRSETTQPCRPPSSRRPSRGPAGPRSVQLPIDCRPREGRAGIPRDPTPHRPIGGQRAAGFAHRSAAVAAGATCHARRSSTTTARARANQSTPTSQSMRAASLPVKPSAP